MFSFLKNIFKSDTRTKTLDGLKGVDYADAVFQNLILDQNAPGISVTLLHDGETLLKKGYGYSDLDNKVPVSVENTLFRIASISKCITGLALGKMVEEGIVDWDDSFFSHVPYFPKKEFDFTLRQLASHTAGIRGYRGKEFALNQPYSIKESIDVFKNDALIFEPGKGYLYNSYDFVLLSLAMQEASGIPFELYVQEKVLSPLGMHATKTPLELVALKDFSISEFYSNYALGFRKASPVQNFYKIAGGGYLSTSEDVAKMGLAILEKRLLKKETYEALFSAVHINEISKYYGLGFQVSQDKGGRTFVGHVGSSVGAYTNFFVYPKEKLVISLVMNCSDPKIQPLLDLVYDKVFRALNHEI